MIAAEYVNFVMNSPYFREIEILPYVKQQCGQANVNGTIMQNMRIPLPPLNEQLRIIAKVDELMAICDKSASKLIVSKKIQEVLAEALVEQVLA